MAAPAHGYTPHSPKAQGYEMRGLFLDYHEPHQLLSSTFSTLDSRGFFEVFQPLSCGVGSLQLEGIEWLGEAPGRSCPAQNMAGALLLFCHTLLAGIILDTAMTSSFHLGALSAMSEYFIHP